MGCTKCNKVMGWIFLIVGVIFLLGDFGIWNWGISWWSALFFLVGLNWIATGSCKDCQRLAKK